MGKLLDITGRLKQKKTAENQKVRKTKTKIHDKKEISLSCETSNEFSGDNDTLDLGSSFIDLINFGISHEFLDRILAIETVSTENLDNTPFKQKKNAFHLIGLRG